METQETQDKGKSVFPGKRIRTDAKRGDVAV